MGYNDDLVWKRPCGVIMLEPLGIFPKPALRTTAPATSLFYEAV